MSSCECKGGSCKCGGGKKDCKCKSDPNHVCKCKKVKTTQSVKANRRK